jgi:hypothetical protein
MCPTHLTHFLSCSSQYSLQHRILKHPQVFSLSLSGHRKKGPAPRRFCLRCGLWKFLT